MSQISITGAGSTLSYTTPYNTTYADFSNIKDDDYGTYNTGSKTNNDFSGSVGVYISLATAQNMNHIRLLFHDLNSNSITLKVRVYTGTFYGYQWVEIPTQMGDLAKRSVGSSDIFEYWDYYFPNYKTEKIYIGFNIPAGASTPDLAELSEVYCYLDDYSQKEDVSFDYVQAIKMDDGVKIKYFTHTDRHKLTGIFANPSLQKINEVQKQISDENVQVNYQNISEIIINDTVHNSYDDITALTLKSVIITIYVGDATEKDILNYDFIGRYQIRGYTRQLDKFIFDIEPDFEPDLNNIVGEKYDCTGISLSGLSIVENISQIAPVGLWHDDGNTARRVLRRVDGEYFKYLCEGISQHWIVGEKNKTTTPHTETNIVDANGKNMKTVASLSGFNINGDNLSLTVSNAEMNTDYGAGYRNKPLTVIDYILKNYSNITPQNSTWWDDITDQFSIFQIDVFCIEPGTNSVKDVISNIMRELGSVFWLDTKSDGIYAYAMPIYRPTTDSYNFTSGYSEQTYTFDDIIWQDFTGRQRPYIRGKYSNVVVKGNYCSGWKHQDKPEWGRVVGNESNNSLIIESKMLYSIPTLTNFLSTAQGHLQNVHVSKRPVKNSFSIHLPHHYDTAPNVGDCFKLNFQWRKREATDRYIESDQRYHCISRKNDFENQKIHITGVFWETV